MTREKAVDLVMNAQQGLGIGGARGTRCWNSGAKTARRNGLQPARDGGSAPHRGAEGSGDAASRVSLVPGIVLTASMSKSYSGAHCARSTAATGGAIDRLGLDARKSYDQLGAALDVVDLTDLRRRVLELS
jgi:hypothetical protein